GMENRLPEVVLAAGRFPVARELPLLREIVAAPRVLRLAPRLRGEVVEVIRPLLELHVDVVAVDERILKMRDEIGIAEHGCVLRLLFRDERVVNDVDEVLIDRLPDDRDVRVVLRVEAPLRPVLGRREKREDEKREKYCRPFQFRLLLFVKKERIINRLPARLSWCLLQSRRGSADSRRAESRRAFFRRRWRSWSHRAERRSGCRRSSRR